MVGIDRNRGGRRLTAPLGETSGSSLKQPPVTPGDLAFQVDELPADRNLVIVDDDSAFLQRLARAMAQRGFTVRTAASVKEGLNLVRQDPPAFAVIDLRLPDGSGLDIVSALTGLRQDARCVIQTGYGNFSSAVTAVKLGAANYVAKPVDADELTDTLLSAMTASALPPDALLSADRVKWEHILRVFELCNHNVSETARRLHMHRRTLQRILAKRAPR
jgi:two-component system, response regulator RegA